MQKCDYLEKNIPKGLFCYTIKSIDHETGRMTINCCPHWRKFNDEYPEQESGYCTYLKEGDWMENGTMLLWDQVKECGINEWSLEELLNEINEHGYIY